MGNNLEKMLDSGQDSARFVLTASLGSESLKLKRDYEELAQVYGDKVAQSTIVLITKENMGNDYKDIRLKAIKEDARSLNLTTMMFQTDHAKFTLDSKTREK